MQKISLPTQWRARAISNFDEILPEIRGRDIAAEVPGCIHLDLMRENLIPDPYLDLNEHLVSWIGRTDWLFSSQFSVSAEAMQEERVDLVCEGLDTVATVWINGTEVGRSENMHVEARFDIKTALHSGENEIRILFASPVYYARQMRDKLGDLPHANSYRDADGVCEPFHFIRKNACNFGWDWGPGLITSGIWKAIRLEAWSVARIKSVRPLVKVANEKVAVIEVKVEIEPADYDADFSAESGWGGVMSLQFFEKNDGTNDRMVMQNLTIYPFSRTFELFIQTPKLWWPRGYGDSFLYDLRIHLIGQRLGNNMAPAWQGKIGLREVELDTSPDEIGAAWTLKVNGKPIWCKGANWIPDDVFLTRANEPKRLEARLNQACEAGLNMMRVWGGGIYETDEFYDLCDQKGLLVWQDFLFACAAYSEESPMKELVESEARFNVARLAKHPSLVLWNGCNENIWGYFDWSWKEKIGEKTWGAGYYFDLLPAIVKELNPTVLYWPGSPYSGSMDIHPLADQYGNKHMWDTWNEVNHTHFRRYSPRFASEFGHQAPPTHSTLARAIPAEKLNPFSDSMLGHQKAMQGNDKLHARLTEYFEMPATDSPEGMADWIYLTQLMQARAMTTAVEWFRTRKTCAGALFWQWNDCWPSTSWSAIDGDGREKPLFYAAKQFFSERLLTIQPDGNGFTLWAHNDTDEIWSDHCWTYLMSFDHKELADSWMPINVPPRALVKIDTFPNPNLALSHKDQQYLVGFASSGAGMTRALWFFDIDKNLAYPEPKFEAQLNGNTLRITAQTLIRDLYINADRVGGRASENLVTLLPGESWETQIEGVAPENLNLETLTSRPVLMCANYFGRK
ncbi:MAG TPA: hypothetical protein VGB45_14480 [Abditibacterium sp.]|jgi:beta-mannosidase